MMLWIYQFTVFKYDFFKIFPCIPFQGGISEQSGRMVYGHDWQIIPFQLPRTRVILTASPIMYFKAVAPKSTNIAG